MVFTSFSQYPKIYTNSTTQHQMRIIFLRPSQTLQIPRFWSLLAFASDARGCSRDAHLCQISALVQARRLFSRNAKIVFKRVSESIQTTSRRSRNLTFGPRAEISSLSPRRDARFQKSVRLVQARALLGRQELVLKSSAAVTSPPMGTIFKEG